MKLIIFMNLGLLINATFAVRNKSEMPITPNFLKGIEWNKKILRHGYIKWLEKKSYTPSNDPVLVQKGSEIYTKHCLQCNEANDKADGPVAKKYNVKASSISDSSKHLHNHTLFVQVAQGSGDMPQWADILSQS